MPLTSQQVGERVAGAINRTEGLLQAMEEAWRQCTTAEPPSLIIANGHFVLAYRRAIRGPRRQIGGSSLRAVKRRAVRRPW
jgi:hypothetical protein